MIKEVVSPNIDWMHFYNVMAGYVGLFSVVVFSTSLVYLHVRYRKENSIPLYGKPQVNRIGDFLSLNNIK